MTHHDIESTRRAMQVRWDAAREGRVLRGVLASSKRRTWRRRAVAAGSLALAVSFALRWAPKAADAFESLSTAASEPPVGNGRAAVPTDVSDDGGQPERNLSGVAGMGGGGSRARQSSAGAGGSAGTG